MAAPKSLETVASPEPPSQSNVNRDVVVPAEILSRRRVARALKAVEAEIESAPARSADPYGYFEIYREAMKAGATVVNLDIDGSDADQLDLTAPHYGLSSSYYLQ